MEGFGGRFANWRTQSAPIGWRQIIEPSQHLVRVVRVSQVRQGSETEYKLEDNILIDYLDEANIYHIEPSALKTYRTYA